MSRRRWIPWGCFLAALVCYVVTLSPSVGFIDSGELSTVCATLGIAHPTGYPVYTLFGHIFTWLPVGSVAWRTNLLSALWSAMSVGMVVWIVLSFLGNVESGKVKQGNLSSPIMAVTAIVAGGYFAFSTVHWVHAVTTEVYSMTVFLVALLLAGLLRWFPKGDGGGNRQWIFLWCYLWGLGFGNHLMIVFLAPVALVAVLLYWDRFQQPARTFLTGAGLFVVGISVCLYLPIRSSLDPLLDWGDPQSLERFWNHLTAKQYRIWMFSHGFDVLVARLAGSVGNLWQWISPPGVLMALVGFVVGWFRRPKLNGILLTLFLADLLYSLNYDIPDIDPYYLPSHLVMAVWVGIGGYAILSAMFTKQKAFGMVVSAALVASLLWLFLSHWNHASHRKDTLAEALGKGALDSAPDDALVLNGFWDLQSIAYYLQEIEEYRRDVTMIDVLLMERSWYVRQQMRRHPEVFDGLQLEAAEFLGAVADFEVGRPYDATVIENRYLALVNGLIEKNLPKRRVLVGFLSSTNHPGIARGFNKIPREVFYEIDRGNPADAEPCLALDMDQIAHPEWVRTRRTRWFMEQLVRMFVMRSQYQAERGEFDTALESVNRALRLKPDDPLIHKIQSQLEVKLYRIQP
jgi:hypothetical protein